MANETQDVNQEANPVNGAEQIPVNIQGNDTTVGTPQTTEPKNNEGNKTYSQKDLDDIAAKARGTAERETTRNILAKLGLKSDELDKLSAYKEAYESSLSDEEKKNQIMEDLQAENLTLSQTVEEKEYVIKALIEMTGKKEEDVEKIVKMAKGLKTEDGTIEDAVKEVISMINIDNQTAPASVVDIPKSQPLTQPSATKVETGENPWKDGQVNLTKQGEIAKKNPERAKQLAAEAGITLKF